MADKEFNPSEHLTDIKGKQYLEVKWRLVWLRDQYPNAQLTTEMIEHSESHAIFKAHVYVAGTEPGESAAVATGYGSETKSDFGDFIEKAETKAIGRALAALGLGTQFCDDFEEEGSVTDAPVQRRGPVKSYDGRRKVAGNTNQPGQARNALRRVLTKKFGPDEKAAFEFMQSVEADACKGTTIDFSLITVNRCKEIIALAEPYDPGAEDHTNVEEPA